MNLWPITQFQSTLPSRGATPEPLAFSCTMCIFQSTLPSRGATAPAAPATAAAQFQSTLPSRGATYTFRQDHSCMYISIHAPLAGSDLWAYGNENILGDFNPRSPRGERRTMAGLEGATRRKFQSTLPSRGATSLLSICFL